MINDLYYDGSNFYIKFEDGTIKEVESEDLFQKCDILLSMYGLGNHNNFSSFVDMVNEEDPIVIEGLLKAAVDRIERTYGTKDSKSKKYKMNVPVNETVSHNKQAIKYDNIVSPDDNKKMEMFLRFWGASKEEIKDAKEKISKRKISNEDVSWINSKSIIEENFNLKEGLKTIKRSREGCENIQVSLEKMIQSRNIKDG